MKDNSSKPPRGLSREAGQLWRRLTGEFSIEDEAGKILLQITLEAFDRMRGAQVMLARDGTVVTDRFGQFKTHPATLVERDARSAFYQGIRQLKLDPNSLSGVS